MGAGKPYRDKNGEGPARTGTLERRGKEVSAYSGKRTDGKQIFVNTMNIIPQRAAAR